MTLTEIRRRLEELGIRPSRRLGQNFLHDQNVASKIVELAEIQSDEQVLEIGPGLGAITEYIFKKTDRLTLIEKDHRLAGFLREKFPPLEVREADALTELPTLSSQLSTFCVLGNLPYSVASPIIVRLCEGDLRPARMLFTIQLEVAERLVAKPRTKDYGLLTLLTQSFYDIALVRKIPATVFWPKPEVASAVVQLVRRKNQPFFNQDQESHFREKVKQAFQKRRKTLGAIFGRGQLPSIVAERRPEELAIEEWIEMSTRADWRAEDEMFDVVNERDEVVGQKPRSEVHRTGLWHRAVHVFVWNKKGELLLQKRSAFKDVAPNTWDSSAAGHLAVGEGYDAAAAREIVEELGVSVPLRLTSRLDACENLGWEFVHVYEARSEGPFQFPRTEISEVRWWMPEGIDAAIAARPNDFARSFRHIWSQIKR